MIEILFKSGPKTPWRAPLDGKGKQLALEFASLWADAIGQVPPRVSPLPLSWGEMQ